MKSITIMDQRYTTYGTDHFLIAPLTDFDGGGALELLSTTSLPVKAPTEAGGEAVMRPKCGTRQSFRYPHTVVNTTPDSIKKE